MLFFCMKFFVISRFLHFKIGYFWRDGYPRLGGCIAICFALALAFLGRRFLFQTAPLIDDLQIVLTGHSNTSGIGSAAFQLKNVGPATLLIGSQCNQSWTDTNGVWRFQLFKFSTDRIVLRSGETCTISVADPPESKEWSSSFDYMYKVSDLARLYRVVRSKLPFLWIPPDDPGYVQRGPRVSNN